VKPQRPFSVITGGLDQPADADLLARSAAGSEAAFSILVDRYFPVVHRVVWRMMNGHADAEDVAQEAFLKLWRDPHQVREAGALKGWLIRVASNQVMDKFRRSPREQSGMVDDLADAVADVRPLADQQMDTGRASTAIDLALASLPDRQRLALTLVHFEHLTNIAAASAMEISVDALESLLARARRTLKERLTPQRDELLHALATGRA
jgi:RNA polymerase sigma-70 factor, ECF subfamily